MSCRRVSLLVPGQVEFERLDEVVGAHAPDVDAVQIVESLRIEDRRRGVDALEREALAELLRCEDLLLVT